MHKRSCKKKKESGGRKFKKKLVTKKKKLVTKISPNSNPAFADQKGPLSVQHNGGK